MLPPSYLISSLNNSNPAFGSVLADISDIWNCIEALMGWAVELSIC